MYKHIILSFVIFIAINSLANGESGDKHCLDGDWGMTRNTGYNESTKDEGLFPSIHIGKYSLLTSEIQNTIAPSTPRLLVGYTGGSTPSDSDIPIALLVLAKNQWNLLQPKTLYRQGKNNSVITEVNNDHYYYSWKAEKEELDEGFRSNSESEKFRENSNKDTGEYSNDYYFYSYQSLSDEVNKNRHLPTTLSSLPESNCKPSGSVHFNQSRNDNSDSRVYNNSSYYYKWHFGNEY